MKVVIIGASGLIGNNCQKVLQEEESFEVIGTYFSFKTNNTQYFNTLNLEDTANFDIDTFAPNIIIHCGALTHVDYCEENEQESYEKTVVSTQNIIALAKKYQSKVVYISTDYVFDGKNGPYTEDADTNPICVYGKHKLEAETLVRNELKTAIIIRVTNVYGEEERGKNFIARIIAQIEEGKMLDLKLPYDQYATPVNAYDVARAIKLLLRDKQSGVFNVASTDWVNRCQLIELIRRHYPDTNMNLTPVSTIELAQKAKRPLLGGLISKKFLDLYPNFVFSNVDDYLNTHKD